MRRSAPTGWGEPYGETPFETPQGRPVWLFRKGQRCRFFNAKGRRHTDERGITYTVAQNWPRTAWYVYAYKAGYRMSNTMRTSSAHKGEMWRTAVEAGNVGLVG